MLMPSRRTSKECSSLTHHRHIPSLASLNPPRTTGRKLWYCTSMSCSCSPSSSSSSLSSLFVLCFPRWVVFSSSFCISPAVPGPGLVSCACQRVCFNSSALSVNERDTDQCTVYSTNSTKHQHKTRPSNDRKYSNDHDNGGLVTGTDTASTDRGRWLCLRNDHYLNSFNVIIVSPPDIHQSFFVHTLSNTIWVWLLIH